MLGHSVFETTEQWELVDNLLSFLFGSRYSPFSGHLKIMLPFALYQRNCGRRPENPQGYFCELQISPEGLSPQCVASASSWQLRNLTNSSFLYLSVGPLVMKTLSNQIVHWKTSVVLFFQLKPPALLLLIHLTLLLSCPAFLNQAFKETCWALRLKSFSFLFHLFSC